MKKTAPPPKSKKSSTKKVAATKNEVKTAGEKVMKKYNKAIKGLAKR